MTRDHARRKKLRRGLLLAIVAVVAATAWYGNRRVPANADKTPIVHGTATHESVPGDRLRVGAFNIHAGKGTDRRVNLDRTAALLEGLDLVALNEVDGDLFLRANQAGVLGEKLGVAWLFAPTERRWWHDHFGNAILSRIALDGIDQIALPGTQNEGHRNAIVARVRQGDRTVRILATHIDRQIDREVQLEQVIDLFLGLEEPAIMMGDLNTPPDDPRLQRLLATPGVVDAGAAVTGELPDDRIDWIIVRGLRPVSAAYENNDASNHPLVWVELALE